MNRLVIIGNGFDLAHGLPTSYKDFIDDYWNSVSKQLSEVYKYEDLLVVCDVEHLNTKFKNRKLNYDDIKDFDSIKKLVSQYSSNSSLKFTNGFFGLLNDVIGIEKWVDIENVYYTELKKIVKKVSKDGPSGIEISLTQKRINVQKLNKEFDQIRNLLENYLKEKIEEKYEDIRYSNNPINDVLLPELSLPFFEKKYLEEFQFKDHSHIRKFLEETKSGYRATTYFLSFNYTDLSRKYFSNFAFSKHINYIHGKINDSLNKLNFGFGDEMDEDYKLIENLDDNEYLKNFKSFQYLQNSNYKNLLDFIESDEKFQVYVMGHSCGLSDRTMLNTIFENPNCISIKVFYHLKEDGTDNYTEMIQNISRHFNKKKLMREKIVNKSLCQPMPQIKLLLK